MECEKYVEKEQIRFVIFFVYCLKVKFGDGIMRDLLKLFFNDQLEYSGWWMRKILKGYKIFILMNNKNNKFYYSYYKYKLFFRLFLICVF